MLDVLNGYGHGFVAIPTILACREAGVFRALETSGHLDVAELTERLSGNSGHLAAALRLLHSLAWLDRDDAGRYQITVNSERYQEIPADVLDWWQFPIEGCLGGTKGMGELRPWIDRLESSWQVTNQETAALLDGVFVVPLLTAMNRRGWLAARSGETPTFISEANGTLREQLASLFVALGWAHDQDGGLQMTDLGGFVSERALILGTLGAYTSMLSQLPMLLIGDPSTVFSRDSSGHEQHVERTLNVIASGFQHEKYFGDVEDIMVAIFDQPIECQPDYVADMGCGDGTFLKRVHSVIADKTARGRVLDDRPVTMIGADFNEKALQATSKTLGDIPHFVIQGDIGNPEKLADDLQISGVADPDKVLHIRSFLDHDRPFLAPQDSQALARRSRIQYQGVHVDSQGSLIDAPVVVQSLVEHLGRWAEVASRHGLVLLEVHCVAPLATRAYLAQSESLHFDAYHAFSMQYLVDADVFTMSAAEVGLFAKSNYFRRYPKTLPFCRITLSWFEKRAYTIRNADPSDLDAIEQLPVLTQTVSITAEAIEMCIDQDPLNTYVVEMDGSIVGAAICLRTSDMNSSLHDPDGEIIRVESIRMLAEHQAGELKEELTHFVAQQSILKAGVTRQYTAQRAGESEVACESDTAKVGESETRDIPRLVDETVQCLMEGNGETYSPEKTFYQLGLDSLDHMELATLLSKSLDGEVDSSVLFTHETPDALSEYLQKREQKKSKTGSLFSFLKRSPS